MTERRSDGHVLHVVIYYGGRYSCLPSARHGSRAPYTVESAVLRGLARRISLQVHGDRQKCLRNVNGYSRSRITIRTGIVRYSAVPGVSQYAGYPWPVTVRIRAMLSAERGWASGSPALRVGLSSPIGSTCARGSRAVPVKSGTPTSMWTASGPAGTRSGAVAAAPAGPAARVLAGRHVQAGPGRVLVF
jgi:hypothetical protein